MKITKAPLFIAFAAKLVFVISAEDDDPIVNTRLGMLMGSSMHSRLGQTFYAFRGVPYGKSPSGDQKFLAPEPIEPWDGVYNATQEGSMCIQPDAEDNEISEDCLKLNVYTKDLYAHISAAPKRPVLVYIPGGGFYIGSGSYRYHAGPENLMDHDVVFVAINYRLGSLGFLATGTADAPGNAAMKDQVLALKWVRDHIENFGGDPNCVTIMGHSAGGMSVSLHLVSSMSQGLFHRAIAMSGAATAQWKIPTDQLNIAQQQASFVGCPIDPISAMVVCLKQTSSLAIGKSSPKFFNFSMNPLLVWTPVVEPDFGQERFLTDDPIKLFQAGKFAKVPVLAGITKDEFAQPAVMLVVNSTLLQLFNNNYYNLAPLCFLYERDSQRSIVISDRLKKAYLNDKPADRNSIVPLNNVFADSLIGFGVHRFVNLVSSATPVYYYKSSYVGRYSHLYFPKDKPYGVVHTDDLFYVLVLRTVAPIFRYPDPESETVERMTRYWINFVRNGNPNNNSDEVIGLTTWPTYGNGSNNFLNIGDHLTLEQGLYEERFKVWDELFPLNEANIKSSPKRGYLLIMLAFSMKFTIAQIYQ